MLIVSQVFNIISGLPFSHFGTNEMSWAIVLGSSLSIMRFTPSIVLPVIGAIVLAIGFRLKREVSTE